MKIIFDSEEQKQDFVDLKCPSDVLWEIVDYLCHEGCEECWKNSGIELEVEDE